MRLPWSTSRNKTSRNNKSADRAPVSKSELALSGAAGDGKVHDLQYWLDSGFLTLPKPDPNRPAPQPKARPQP
jgi:hypothetical protein